ncbi:MAG TPA: PEP/pyruvate-binding domain-containing protein [Candidatus Lokiarchaeia archaeon]|nr:PEP/pyruvate-binding domain-containing protein [Candidatus Lokiarchaeia archaeon]
MEEPAITFSTGISALDRVFLHVLPGDNIVWQVDSIEEEYLPFVHRFCENVMKEGKNLVYFRFAEHVELVPWDVPAKVFVLNPAEGFESFLSQILTIIEQQGEYTCYVFDSLSELTVDWYSDWMLGNFFLIVCPFLYELKTVTYFGLLRNYHAQHAVNDIHGTTQIIVDVFKHKETGEFFIHPLKVFERTSPTMYTLHAWESEDNIHPVTNSTIIADLRTGNGQVWVDFTTQQVDVWTRTLVRAKEILEDTGRGHPPSKDEDLIHAKLLRMMIARDPRVLRLAEEYLPIGDVLAIGQRVIGTGLIGGKSVGLLLAHAIMKQDNPYWQQRLESHDSFFIGSDVFYTFVVRNRCWWTRWRLRSTTDFLEQAELVRGKMLEGDFPDRIKDQFWHMLDYFGQSPIIVRSSSLMEDAYKNSFSGKYESVFCPNQGTPEERFQDFINAVRRVYASTLSEEALNYRKRRGLFDRDEQMALLVQRVSGAVYGDYFFPQIAGVGDSYNPYVWEKDIDPKAGMIRLVFGLGTRAVERADDDFTRIVSLSAPNKRPEASIDDITKYAQRKVDLLDLRENTLTTKYFNEVMKQVHDLPDLPTNFFTSLDGRTLTFEYLLSQTSFVSDLKELLATLQKAYNHPVDVEFTANFSEDGSYRIFPVQCRPFQAKGNIGEVQLPAHIALENTILQTCGPIIGNSIATAIDRIIFVVPEEYSRLPRQRKYGLAGIVGKLLHIRGDGPRQVILLIGPGRWATTTPELGVPITLGDINAVSVICEVAKMHANSYPDVSLGTHFFNDLVEMDMLYLAIYPEKSGYVLNEEILVNTPNQIDSLLLGGEEWNEVVRVIDATATDPIRLHANNITQECICYFDR